jgi:acyl carrier protein
MDVVKVVNEVLMDRFEVPTTQLVPTALLKEDLKLDSLDFVDMIVVLEEKMGGSMPEFDFLSIKTVGDIYNLVDKIKADIKVDSK